jgi:non-canonical purine NTP pyrophosphatase (RdgB/HAM1 family)
MDRCGEVLLASQNAGKLGEMRQLVSDLPLRIVGPRDIGIEESPDETGRTFIQNATLKARYYARRSGLLTVADDSGLSVDALRGRPGLYSSRFGGEGASDADRNALLLQLLKDVPLDHRGARFTSAVVAVAGEDVVFSATETVEGRICEELRGSNGFGYDPLFYYPPYDRTFGEVSAQQKAQVSHRGKAFARLRQYLVARLRNSGCPEVSWAS